MRLRLAAAGIALGEAANEVREVGGNNRGPAIRKYARNAGFEDDGLPWCAMGVQWCADGAARLLQARNPLDEVELEGLVRSYALEGHERGWIIEPHQARAGDLVLYEFPGGDPTWNHIGFVLEELHYIIDADEDRFIYDPFHAIEGNTGPGVGLTPEERDREGDGWYVKRRRVRPGKTLFLRWDELEEGP